MVPQISFIVKAEIFDFFVLHIFLYPFQAGVVHLSFLHLTYQGGFHFQFAQLTGSDKCHVELIKLTAKGVVLDQE